MTYLWAEGVNFSNCLYDTNDLSTIRGSSNLLSDLARPVEEILARHSCNPRLLRTEASSAMFAISPPEDSEDIEQAVTNALASSRDTWRHLSIVVGTGPSEAEAISSARVAQYQTWSVPPPENEGAWRQDALDGMRPAVNGCAEHLSRSVKERRDAGRDDKSVERLRTRGVSEDALQAAQIAKDFGNLLKAPPAWVSDAAKTKLAVIHLDGDNFGKAKSASDDPQAFADKLSNKMTGLLDALVRQSRVTLDDERVLVALEVLVWGGDDITVVIPAWSVLPFFSTFYQAVADWQIDGTPLGFTGAAIITNYKAPIRQMTALAETAVNELKVSGSRGAFTVYVFEGGGVPDVTAGDPGALARHRENRFGVAGPSLAIPGSGAQNCAAHMRRIRSGAGHDWLSRSVAHRLVKGCATQGEGWLDQEIGLYETRVASRVPEAHSEGSDHLRFPELEGTQRPLSVNLKMVLDLWPYIKPLEESER